MLARRRSRHAIGTCTALLLGACSTVPPAGYPPHGDYAVVADYVVPGDGRLRVPASHRDLVVHELRADPEPAGETFGPGHERFWLWQAGTRVSLHCRFRAYAGPDGTVPGPAMVLPGARRLREVQP